MKWIKFFTILAIIFFAMDARAVTMTFSDFSDTSDLTLNGSTAVATTSDGVVLRLTEAVGNQSGSAFSTQTVNAAKFSTFFKFRITDPGGSLFDCNEEPGADGIVFVIQSVASDIGGGGQGIGYSGIDTSIGVEFDTWCNAANNDPNSNHLGIDINGSVVHAENTPDTAVITPDFDDGNIWYAWVDYDGTTLEIRVSQSGSRPVPVTLQKDIEIPAILGQNDAYIGFTSGTGVDWGNHDILYWEYKDSYDPIEITDCQEEFQAGYAAGRQSCIDDPASCGLDGNGGSVTLNPDLSFTVSNMVYNSPFGSMNFEVSFSFLDQQNDELLWKLDSFSIK